MSELILLVEAPPPLHDNPLPRLRPTATRLHSKAQGPRPRGAPWEPPQRALASLATLGFVVQHLRRIDRRDTPSTLVREYRLLLPDEKLLADELTRTRRLLESRLAARRTRRKS